MAFWLTVAGMINALAARTIKDDMVPATVSLNFCSIPIEVPVRVLWIPPAMKQHPSTRRELDKILPNILDCTIRICPCFKAMMLT